MRWLVWLVAIAGCGRLGFDYGEARDSAGGGDDAASAYDRSWAAPAGGTYAAVFAVAAASDNPAANVHFTKDQTTPTISSPAGVGVADVGPFTSGVPVQFFAESATGNEPVNSETYIVDASKQTATGYTVTGLDLTNGSPVAVVSPGATITGSASIHDWANNTCPGCILLVVYAIESTAQGCFMQHQPGAWPGGTATWPITFTAPLVPGTYGVFGSIQEQVNCANAMSVFNVNPMSGEPHRLGIVVVR
jgi:hypothetical protein